MESHRAEGIRRRLVVRLVLLGLMLAGALRGQADGPVELPPFLVEEKTKGPPWRYAEAMGYEILSRCSDDMTRRVVEAHYRLHVLLAQMLPPALQLQFSVPRGLLLYDEELQPAASREVIAEMLRGAPAETPDYRSGPRGLRMPVPVERYSFLPNLRLWDRDSMMVFMIVRRGEFVADRLALTPDYVSYLVRGRLPGLPAWFVTGFLTLYPEAHYDGSVISLPPLRWISELHTAAVKKDPRSAPAPLPWREFFTAQLPAPPADGSYDPKVLWQAQAALFVRWGLEGGGPEQRTAFWKFVERAAVEGSGERVFRDCFGFDPSALQAQLATYLSRAVRRDANFEPATRIVLPPFVLTNATDGQIARLKGDWERLEIAYVQRLYPRLTPKYLEQARRTLHRAYDRDDRDPRLLAVMGLCELDAGNVNGARELLEAAAALGEIRPRANYELARLRFVAFSAAPEASNGRLSVSQMSGVLQPLFAARRGEPPLPEVYGLIAQTWEHGAAQPNRGHLAVLDEGVRLFPRDTELVLRAAALYVRSGFVDSARVLLGIAERSADAATAPRVAALREQLAQAPAP